MPRSSRQPLCEDPSHMCAVSGSGSSLCNLRPQLNGRGRDWGTGPHPPSSSRTAGAHPAAIWQNLDHKRLVTLKAVPSSTSPRGVAAQSASCPALAWLRFSTSTSSETAGGVARTVRTPESARQSPTHPLHLGYAESTALSPAASRRNRFRAGGRLQWKARRPDGRANPACTAKILLSYVTHDHLTRSGRESTLRRYLRNVFSKSRLLC